MHGIIRPSDAAYIDGRLGGTIDLKQITIQSENCDGCSYLFYKRQVIWRSSQAGASGSTMIVSLIDNGNTLRIEGQQDKTKKSNTKGRRLWKLLPRRRGSSFVLLLDIIDIIHQSGAAYEQHILFQDIEAAGNDNDNVDTPPPVEVEVEQLSIDEKKKEEKNITVDDHSLLSRHGRSTADPIRDARSDQHLISRHGKLVKSTGDPILDARSLEDSSYGSSVSKLPVGHILSIGAPPFTTQRSIMSKLTSRSSILSGRSYSTTSMSSESTVSASDHLLLYETKDVKPSHADSLTDTTSTEVDDNDNVSTTRGMDASGVYVGDNEDGMYSSKSSIDNVEFGSEQSI